MQSGQPEWNYFIYRDGEQQLIPARWCRRAPPGERPRPSQWDRIDDPNNLVGYPEGSCCQCSKTDNDDGSKVLWRCQPCGRLVCHECTLTIPRQGRVIEYYATTLCSEACWEAAGRPDE